MLKRKHRAPGFYDPPSVDFPPIGWLDASGRNPIRHRAGMVPEDNVLEIEKELKAQLPWNNQKINLRFLALARSSTLTYYEIAKTLNSEFDTSFTTGALAGRLDRLRAISLGLQSRGKKARLSKRALARLES